MSQRILPLVTLLIGIFAALLGLVFGSFLNVCISRLPRHESVVAPRSRCPGCRTPIGALDNFPLLSFVLLRGKCRWCGEPISWRYPAVELATAAMWELCWLSFGWSLPAAGMAVLCFLLLGLAAMDAENMLLPDAFTLPGIVLGVLYSGVVCNNGGASQTRCAGISLAWTLVAGAAILAIRGLYWLVRRREGMGLGDAKLFAMIAAWLGLENSLLVFFLAVVGGALYGIFRLRGRIQGGDSALRLPLGSFLCAAAIYAIFQGHAAIAWYLGFFR